MVVKIVSKLLESTGGVVLIYWRFVQSLQFHGKKNFFVGIVQSILHNFGNSYSEYIFQTNLMLVKNEI